jgi:hypothetical protein
MWQVAALLEWVLLPCSQKNGVPLELLQEV